MPSSTSFTDVSAEIFVHYILLYLDSNDLYNFLFINQKISHAIDNYLQNNILFIKNQFSIPVSNFFHTQLTNNPLDSELSNFNCFLYQINQPAIIADLMEKTLTEKILKYDVNGDMMPWFDSINRAAIKSLDSSLLVHIINYHEEIINLDDICQKLLESYAVFNIENDFFPSNKYIEKIANRVLEQLIMKLHNTRFHTKIFKTKSNDELICKQSLTEENKQEIIQIIKKGYYLQPNLIKNLSEIKSKIREVLTSGNDDISYLNTEYKEIITVLKAENSISYIAKNLENTKHNIKIELKKLESKKTCNSRIIENIEKEIQSIIKLVNSHYDNINNITNNLEKNTVLLTNKQVDWLQKTLLANKQYSLLSTINYIPNKFASLINVINYAKFMKYWSFQEIIDLIHEQNSYCELEQEQKLEINSITSNDEEEFNETNQEPTITTTTTFASASASASATATATTTQKLLAPNVEKIIIDFLRYIIQQNIFNTFVVENLINFLQSHQYSKEFENTIKLIIINNIENISFVLMQQGALSFIPIHLQNLQKIYSFIGINKLTEYPRIIKNHENIMSYCLNLYEFDIEQKNPDILKITDEII